MFDYISSLYYGEPIHTPQSTPLENKDSKLSRQLAQVQAEMGETFAQSLRTELMRTLNERQRKGFRAGVQLGGNLMLALLEG